MNRHILAIAAMTIGSVGLDTWGAEPRPLLGLPVPAAALAQAQTQAIVGLGRRLFFDATLSANGQVSCATCHQPEKAFSDGQPLALGIHGRRGTRNTPTVINAALHGTQFWDGRRGSLEEQAADPFVNPAEHGLPDHEAVLAILREDDAYRHHQLEWHRLDTQASRRRSLQVPRWVSDDELPQNRSDPDAGSVRQHG